MKYAIVNKERCQEIGIDPTHRMAHGDDVAITEKELMFSSAQGKTLEEKANNAQAVLMTIDEIKAWDYKNGGKEGGYNG